MKDDITRIKNIMMCFNDLIPSRVTVQQIYAFMEIAENNLLGNRVTLSDIKSLTKIGQHLSRSISIFYTEESGGDTDCLGWVYTESDPNDKRRKYLLLTDLGRIIIEELSVLGRI